MRQWLLNYQSLSIMTKMMMVILAWLLSREAWTSCIVWYQQVIWYQQTSNEWGVKHVFRLNEIILSSPVLRFKQSLYPFWYFYVFKTCTAQLLQRLPTSENGNDLNEWSKKCLLSVWNVCSFLHSFLIFKICCCIIRIKFV